MKLLVGTSGFSYPGWRGGFYPEGLPASEMLRSYAARLPTVEINNTFYRMPQPALLQGWLEKAPPEFRFALKAPRRITHIARLKGAGEALGRFLEVAATLGTQLGPLLFQLPPFVQKDAQVLREFLALLPEGTLAAFEFRHPSWFDDEVYGALADRQAALVAGDPDEGEALPLVATAGFGYLRLRSATYDLRALEAWRERIEAQPWQVAHVYLKHEVLGPAYAEALQRLFRGERAELPEPPEPPELHQVLKPPKAGKKAVAKLESAKKSERTKSPVKKKNAARR